MPIDPLTGQLIGQGVIATAQAITRGGPRRQYKWNKKAAEDTNAMNRANAVWQLEENKRIQQEQRVYDSPENQMARYKAAGLNPHLIYGGGSGSSGGTFPISSPGIAPSRIDAPSASYPDLAGSFLQAGQTMAGTQLATQKAEESEAREALIDVQVDIAKSNPMLNPAVYKSLTASMIAVADAKAKEQDVLWMIREQTTDSGWRRYTLGSAKIEAEVEALEQKLGLNTEDLKIRNSILQSKEFDNVVKEAMAAWYKDGELTSQHIYQGLMLMLTKWMMAR